MRLLIVLMNNFAFGFVFLAFHPFELGSLFDEVIAASEVSGGYASLHIIRVLNHLL